MAEGEKEWAGVSRECRRLEGEVEVKLESYAKFASSYSAASSSSASASSSSSSSSASASSSSSRDVSFSRSNVENQEHIASAMCMEIEELLMRLSTLNQRLGGIASGGAIDPALRRMLQQHRENFQQYTDEYRHTKSSVQETRQRAELLLPMGGQASFEGSSYDTLLRERAALHSADRSADDFLSMGEDARRGLQSQNHMTRGNSDALSQLKGAFGDIDSVISKIKSKKNRDCLILTLFIAFLLCFLIYWWLRS
eukprot:TRINITY_DN2471_c0_g2_i3.p1 TRINITY_DN2471_c0_g2~~TRINITY_DN2471_c0_g2_i3.p1  ORF type:complete len:254 (+),score=85.39 TRINITY_DN2471_c0_g2_i3:116-877(+)